MSLNYLKTFNFKMTPFGKNQRKSVITLLSFSMSAIVKRSAEVLSSYDD